MNYLLFGGSGFIGKHLAKCIILNKDKQSYKLYNLDIVDNQVTNAKYINTDVTQSIQVSIGNLADSIIFNLAAVHKSPGHTAYEYFNVNIKGAENVCNFARENDINTIVFTSSIAPYGVSEALKNEESLPMPNTPYGVSKLNAEYIHKLWQAEEPGKRRLIIVRPGVVFGYNEAGNFTRLYKSLKGSYFVYPGRKDTIKAAIYVKDVCRILYETAIYEPFGLLLLNLTYSPAPNIEMICGIIAKVTKVRKPKMKVTPRMLNVLAKIAYAFSRVFSNGVKGIHPDRVKKLITSTNISADKLNKSRYRLQYTFEEAINDWYKDCGKKGLF